MTPKERAAMQQALEALEFCKKWASRIGFDAAITALREALVEQAEQEPVAWWCCVPGQDPILLFDEPSDERYPPNYKEPLYTAPVRTKDLTDDEVADIRMSIVAYEPVEWGRVFARAVIAADREKNRG